jgi:ribonuclease HII
MPRSHRTSGGPDWNLELAARREGYRRVAGIDEAGRGCLFGPVFAAAVILDSAEPLPGLDDSKRVGPDLRSELDARIRETSVAFAVQAVDAASIDLLNILQASRLAMKRAAESLDPAPDFLLIDAVSVETGVAQRSLIKGDRKSRSIAAASILAKVARDRCMLAWDSLYPEYGLRSNKGYPAPAHLAAIREHGCTPLHRQSFRPVARFAALDPRVPFSS